MAATGKAERTVLIREATAVAIVSSRNLPKDLASKVDTDQKFVVHPHVIEVLSDSELLGGYLRTIYERERHLATVYPGSPSFADLGKPGSIGSATRDLAAALSLAMEKKSANPGILFGFLIEVDDGTVAHGVIKADLDDEKRFHFKASTGGAWTLSAVSEMLPPPRTSYAKFAIAPEPNGKASAGVRDITDNTSAADYFLTALEMVVPRKSGTQAAVAQAALDAGYSPEVVEKKLKALKVDTPVTEVVEKAFPKIPERRAAALQGTPTRPMTVVVKNDPYIRVYSTKKPHFELSFDESVQVKIDGRTVTVTLPEDHDPIVKRTR